jgi:TolB-like protein
MEPAPTRIARFLAELKRRRVLRVAAIYAAGGFVVLEAVDLLAPVLLLPEWVYRVVGGLVLLGFPVAMVAAWIFDLTPEGIRRTESSDGEGEEPAAVSVPQIAAAVALGVVVVGVVAMGGWRFFKPPPAFGNTAAVAVLPLANLSADPDDAYFAEGLHDELLTQLYKIGGLRIPSRTTLLRYRETDKDVPSIGEELATQYVLEGSVEPRADRVRIRIQLIDASTDNHLWAENYDRPMEDIHDLQEEIARSIAGELRVRILPSERGQLATRPTESLQAYELYLRGRADVQAGFALVGANYGEWERRWVDAETSFERATEIDPDFALAWAELGMQRARLFWWSMADHEQSTRGARAALDRAQSLEPDLPRVLLAESYYQMWVQKEFQPALDLAERAKGSLPGDADVLLAIAGAMRRLGWFEEAVEVFNELMERNPAEFIWVNEVASTYRAMRRFEDVRRIIGRWEALTGADMRPQRARAAFEETGDTAALRAFYDALPDASPIRSNVELLMTLREFDAALAALDHGPEFRRVQDGLIPQAANYAWVHDLQGDREMARQYAQEVLDFFDDHAGDIRPGRLAEERAYAYATLGDRDRALAEVGAAMEILAPDRWYGVRSREALMYVHVLLGDAQAAIDQLEILLDTDYGGAITGPWVAMHPRFDPLRGHPRFERLIAEHTPPSDP